jgi:tRNA 2-thiocytidine biosynthesis protein TtcA
LPNSLFQLFPHWKNACTCPYGQNSKRRDMRDRIKGFTDGKDSGDVKRRILQARGGGKIDYLTEE